MLLDSIEEIVELIERDALLTGSRALWGAGKNSDWDYVCLEQDFDLLYNKLNKIGWPIRCANEQYGEENGLLFSHKGKEYNLIRLDKNEYRLWKAALSAMQSFSPVIKNRLDKSGRKLVYRGIVDLLRDAIIDL